MSLSILFMQIVICICSWTACFRRRSVFNITPSAASTNKTTPSHSLMAAVTSSEKLTCPSKKWNIMWVYCFFFLSMYLVYRKCSSNNSYSWCPVEVRWLEWILWNSLSLVLWTECRCTAGSFPHYLGTPDASGGLNSRRRRSFRDASGR